MRFLLDENVDVRLGQFLSAAGHDVAYAVDATGASASDIEVLSAADRDSRILITNDRDFGALILGRGLRHSGVILLRLRTTALFAKQTAIEALIRDHADRLHEFLVVTESHVRVRRAR